MAQIGMHHRSMDGDPRRPDARAVALESGTGTCGSAVGAASPAAGTADQPSFPPGDIF